VALGLASGEAAKVLDAVARAVNYTAPVAFWIKLHTAEPGAAGATAPAGNTTRKQATMSAASGGAITNSAALTWTAGEVTTSEDYSHWSAWTASSGGTFLASGTITANAVTAGDQFTIPIGDLDLTLSTAA
jgi:hypothetical protein